MTIPSSKVDYQFLIDILDKRIGFIQYAIQYIDAANLDQYYIDKLGKEIRKLEERIKELKKIQ